jgi:hypothetical protein
LVTAAATGIDVVHVAFQRQERKERKERKERQEVDVRDHGLAKLALEPSVGDHRSVRTKLTTRLFEAQ